MCRHCSGDFSLFCESDRPEPSLGIAEMWEDPAPVCSKVDPTIVKGRHPKDLPDFHWINIVSSNLKTSFSGTFHAVRFEKYADRYLGAFCYRFNRRFNLEEMMGRILRATCNRTARPERLLRSAELAT